MSYPLICILTVFNTLPFRRPFRSHRGCGCRIPIPWALKKVKICIEKSEISQNSHNSHFSHIIFCKIYIVHFYPIIGTTFSVHCPACHAACIKICTEILETLETLLSNLLIFRQIITFEVSQLSQLSHIIFCSDRSDRFIHKRSKRSMWSCLFSNAMFKNWTLAVLRYS